ncbi:MAG: hypothetical protein WAW61_14590 [Methylococcaceae bacterium]
MGFLHQWYGEWGNTCTYCLVDKQLSEEVMINTVEWHIKTCQVSPI